MPALNQRRPRYRAHSAVLSRLSPRTEMAELAPMELRKSPARAAVTPLAPGAAARAVGSRRIARAVGTAGIHLARLRFVFMLNWRPSGPGPGMRSPRRPYFHHP